MIWIVLIFLSSHASHVQTNIEAGILSLADTTELQNKILAVIDTNAQLNYHVKIKYKEKAVKTIPITVTQYKVQHIHWWVPQAQEGLCAGWQKDKGYSQPASLSREFHSLGETREKVLSRILSSKTQEGLYGRIKATV